MARYISTADTAKIIRQELKEKFPDCKFSVRSKSYSGGSSISVEWTDGPTGKEVEAIVFPFQGASFDGMQDLKTHHNSYYKGEEVRWGADFVFASRDYSKVAYEKGLELAKQANHKYWEEAQIYVKAHQSTWKDEIRVSYSYGTGDEAAAREYWDHWQKYPNELPKEMLAGYSFYAEAPAPTPATSAEGEAITLEIRRNEERDGLELKFSSKPGDDILALVKEAGFRFTRNSGGIWYTKYSDAALKFAEALKAAYFSGSTPAEQVEPEQAEEVAIAEATEVTEVAEVEQLAFTPEPEETIVSHDKGEVVEVEFINLKPNSTPIVLPKKES